MANEKELDEKLLRSMFINIRGAEITNIKTQKKDDKGMIKAIGTYIEKKVREEMAQNENKKH